MSTRLPLALALIAWLSPLAFGVWAGTQFGFRSKTAGLPDEVWFALFGAIPGIFAAGASLYLLRHGNFSAQTHLRLIPKVLAMAFFACVGIAAVFLVARG
jgi:hypothetical protein